MSNEIDYVDRIQQHGHSPIKLHVSPVVTNLPQDDSGIWLRNSLKEIASERGLSLASLCRKVFSDYVAEYKNPNLKEGGLPDY